MGRASSSTAGLPSFSVVAAGMWSTTAAEFRLRRQRLARLFEQPVLLGSGPQVYRTPGQAYRFRANSHYLYFGGPPLANAWLYLDGDRATLFYDLPSSAEAVWEGSGPEDLPERYGLDAVRPLSQKRAGSDLADPQLAGAIIQLRLRHDAAAVRQLEQAVDMTVRAHFQAMRATRPERREYQILATLLVSVTQEGGCPGYDPIVTTRGQILHNPHHDGTLQRGDLLLVDFGAETPEGWTGDVTRTFPVRTTFSPRQAEIYELVLRAQQAALALCRPGVEYRDVHLAACHEMAEGLVELGLMRGDPKELVVRGAHALFFPHGIGHLLGLDVHDMEDLGDRAGYAEGHQRSQQYGLNHLRLDRPLEPGMAVTVEPGFYWNSGLLEDPRRTDPLADCLNREIIEAYREVKGIRIEDNVLIQEAGCKVLSAGLPKELQELEVVVNS